MPEESSRRSLADAALIIALVPVVLLPQLVGGVHPHVASAAAALELVALGLLIVDRRRTHGPLRSSWLAAPIAIGLVGTLLQLVPLPGFLRTVLAPVAEDKKAWVTSLLPADAPSVLPVVSMDPPDTAFAAVRLAGALALFIVIGHTCIKRRARALAFRVLLATGLLMFVVAAGHRLLGVQGAWGTFMMKNTIFYAPMVNPNQLARLFGALALVSLGRAVVVRSRIEALWFVAGGTLCGAGVFLTLSRGGMLAFGAASLFFFFLLWRERFQGDTGSTPAALGAQLATVAAIVVGLYVAREGIIGEVATIGGETLESSKTALYLPALSLLEEHWRIGVGNNAFGVAFTERVDARLLGGGFTFTHPENIVVATLVEHGVIFGVAVLASALLVGAMLLLHLKRRSEYAALPALMFLVVGDLFDFALESTAGLFVAAVLLGLCAARLLESKQTLVALSSKRALALGVALAVVVASCAPIAIVRWRRWVDAELMEREGQARRAALIDALAAHPFDAQYCYLLAVDARAVGDAALALKWANRALILSPNHRAAHVEAARALVVMGRLDQALIEYKAAWTSGKPDDRLTREVAGRTKDVALRRSAIPHEPAALASLAEQLVTEKRFDDAQDVLDAAAALADAPASTRKRAIEIALLRADGAGALRRIEALLQGARVDVDLVQLLMTSIAQASGPEQAFAESEQWLTRVVDNRPLLQWRIQTALQLGKLEEAHTTIELLRQRAGDPSMIAWLDRMQAGLLGRQGDTGRQLQLLQKIAARHPNDVTLAIEVANLEVALGLFSQARLSLANAKRGAPGRADVVDLERRINEGELGADRQRRRTPPP